MPVSLTLLKADPLLAIILAGGSIYFLILVLYIFYYTFVLLFKR